jgi:hypothetical protein
VCRYRNAIRSFRTHWIAVGVCVGDGANNGLVIGVAIPGQPDHLQVDHDD